MTWLVITLDGQSGYRVVECDTLESAVREASQYRIGEDWPVWVAQVVAGKGP